MKPTPPGWPRISTALYYDDPRAAIDWLCEAFGFEVRLLVEGDGGSVEHSELVLGGGSGGGNASGSGSSDGNESESENENGVGLVMVGGARPERFPYMRPPSKADGANTQNMMVYVDDVDAHCERARKAGATIVREPEVHDYGPEYWTDRGYECRDPGGHHWWFYQRLATGGKEV